MIADKLNDMQGRTFGFNEGFVKVTGWKMADNDETILVSTDAGMIRISFTEADEKLSQFKPIHTTTGSMATLPDLSVDRSVMLQLKDTLLDNITQIKKDKSYIPQAEAISKNIGQIIDLAKVEISMINTAISMTKSSNQN